MDDVKFAALRAEVVGLRAALAVQQRSIPALPHLDGGIRITWRLWEPALLLSHIDPACEQCDHSGPQMIAFGLAALKAGQPPVIRYQAHRCPACQETRVYRRDTTPDLRTTLTEIAYHPPREAP